MQSNSNNLKFADLFCGAGGMTLGFINNSFVNTFSLDNDKNSSKTYKGYFKDHNLITINIEDISDDDISQLCKDDIDVIIGGPPCQGFSIAGVIGRKFIDDSRNYLFREFFRFVKIIKPKVFVMENVARLYNHKEGKSRDEIIKLFESIGYKVKAKILNSAEFGVPQVRNRVFFIGCYLENFSGFPKGTFEEFRNIKSAIEDLVPLKSGMKSNIPNHNAMNHSEQMLKKMSFLNDGEDRTKIPLNLRPISGDVRKYIKYDSSCLNYLMDITQFNSTIHFN